MTSQNEADVYEPNHEGKFRENATRRKNWSEYSFILGYELRKAFGD
jgi:hypothetical protein